MARFQTFSLSVVIFFLSVFICVKIFLFVARQAVEAQRNSGRPCEDFALAREPSPFPPLHGGPFPLRGRGRLALAYVLAFTIVSPPP